MPGDEEDDEIRAAFDKVFDDDKGASTETSTMMRRREAPVTDVTAKPRTVKRRTGRWHWTLRVGLAALVGFGLGLITPTPEGIEVSRDDGSEDTPSIEIEWGDRRLVVDNPTEMPQSELNQLINELLDATESSQGSGTGG